MEREVSVFDVECPSCKRAYGDFCVDSSGVTVATHVSRKRKAKALRASINALHTTINKNTP